MDRMPFTEVCKEHIGSFHVDFMNLGTKGKLHCHKIMRFSLLLESLNIKRYSKYIVFIRY